jgi:hypothetical protein
VVPASALKEEKDLFALLDKKAAISNSIKAYKVHTRRFRGRASGGGGGAKF